MTEVSESPQIGDRVLARGQLATIDRKRTDPVQYRVSFADANIEPEWFDAQVITQLPREPNLRELIAGAITTAERNFSYAVGTGEIQPGEYLSDFDKADQIMAALNAAGYKIVKEASS